MAATKSQNLLPDMIGTVDVFENKPLIILASKDRFVLLFFPPLAYSFSPATLVTDRLKFFLCIFFLMTSRAIAVVFR